MNPQNDSSGSSPDAPGTLGQALEAPQAAPAVGQPPDTSTLPPSPKQGGEQDADWRAMFQEERERRQGLDRRLQQEQNARQQLAVQLQQLQQQAPAPSKKEPPQPSEPEKPQALPQADILQQAIQQRQAEQYRDLLIAQYEQELGVPLSLFKDRIAAVPPQLGASGEIDDSAQRAEIQTMAQALQQVQGQAQRQTQETLLAGQTPGSAPGAPAPTTGEDIYQEFLDILDIQSTEEFQNLTRGEQDRVEARYLELLEHPDVQDRHGGQTRPAMDWDEMQETVRQLVKQVNARAVASARPPGTM